MKKYEVHIWVGTKVISFVFDNWTDAESNYRLMSGPKRLINREKNMVVREYNWRF